MFVVPVKLCTRVYVLCSQEDGEAGGASSDDDRSRWHAEDPGVVEVVPRLPMVLGTDVSEGIM